MGLDNDGTGGGWFRFFSYYSYVRNAPGCKALRSYAFSTSNFARVSNKVSSKARAIGLSAMALTSLILAPFVYNYIGFEAFDGLADAGLRASANYYYGQFQTARELQDIFS